MRVANARMGTKSGKPRLYLSGRWLVLDGWTSGTRFSVTYDRGRIELVPDPSGRRRVSGKRNGQIAVIDINGAELAEAFGDVRWIVVETTPSRITVRERFEESDG